MMVFNSIVKYIHEDGVSKQIDISEGDEFTSSYSKDVFLSWDNNICKLAVFPYISTPHLTPSCFSLPASEQEASLYGQSLSQLLQEKLKDTEEAGAKKALTDLQVVVLWTRRFLGFVVFGLWQCSSYAVIIYLTVNTVEVQRIVSEVSFLRTLAGSIPSLAVTIINAMSPAIIGK